LFLRAGEMFIYIYYEAIRGYFATGLMQLYISLPLVVLYSCYISIHRDEPVSLKTLKVDLI